MLRKLLRVRGGTVTAALSSPSERAPVCAALRGVVRRAGAAGIRPGAACCRAAEPRAAGPAARAGERDPHETTSTGTHPSMYIHSTYLAEANKSLGVLLQQSIPRSCVQGSHGRGYISYSGETSEYVQRNQKQHAWPRCSIRRSIHTSLIPHPSSLVPEI